MTPEELAVARDRVTRARLIKVAENEARMGRNKRGWSAERLAAGDAALEALRLAIARNTKERARVSRARCVYCGKRCMSGNPAVCFMHSDLPALDPFYVDQGLTA